MARVVPMSAVGTRSVAVTHRGTDQWTTVVTKGHDLPEARLSCARQARVSDVVAFADEAAAGRTRSAGSSTAQFGVIVFLASDVMLFAPFFAAYFLLRSTNEPWPPDGRRARRRPHGSGDGGPRRLVVHDDAVDRAGLSPDGRRAMRRWLLVTIALGAIFLANQIAEYTTLDFRADDHPYGSIYWLLTGLHGAHVTAGLGALAMLFVRIGARRSHESRRHLGRGSVAVLAPRRHHLVVRVRHDLGAAVGRRRCSMSYRSCSRPPPPAVTRRARSGRRTTAARAAHRRSSKAGPKTRSVPPLRRPVRVVPRRATARASPTVARRSPTRARRRSTSCCAPDECRSPLPTSRPKRGPVRYSEEEIVALVEYAGAFGDGPEIPDVDIARRRPRSRRRAVPPQLRRLPRGVRCRRGDRRRAGGAVADGVDTPTEIGQAILVGPGAMPSFPTFTSETSTTSPPTSTTCSGARPRLSTSSAAPDRWPKGSPPGSWADPADRPDPLDRHAARGPRHARRRRARRDAKIEP